MMLPKELLNDLEKGNRTNDFVFEKEEKSPPEGWLTGRERMITVDESANMELNSQIWRMEARMRDDINEALFMGKFK